MQSEVMFRYLSGVFLLVVGVYLLRWLWSRRQMYALAWKLNGDWSLPLVGHLFMFLRQEEILKSFEAMLKRHVGPIGVWLGPNLFVLIDHPDDVATVLGSNYCLEKADIYQMMANRLQTKGLVSSEGAVWRKHRKLIGQGFSESTVNGYLDMFNKHIGDMLVELDSHDGSGYFNLKPLSNVYLMNTILDTTLGHDVSEEDKYTYEKFFATGQNIISKLVYQPWHQIDLYWRFTRWPKFLTTFNKLHNNIFDKLIEQRLEKGCDRLTLIDKLLRIMEESNDISIPDIKSECNTIMMAGSDTSALTFATTVMFLAMYPEHQQRVFEEVDAVLGGTERAMTRADIDKLTYTEMCIREVMRITPIVPMIGRRNIKPITMRSGIEMPVNTSFAICIDAVHHNKQVWGEDANVFRPERMSAENIRQQHPYAFLGFSGGPRNCIGYKYAIVIMKMAVARMVHRFRVSTPLKFEDIHYSVDINIHFLMEHSIAVERRNNEGNQIK